MNCSWLRTRVRAIEIDGEPWLVEKDAAEELTYEDSS